MELPVFLFENFLGLIIVNVVFLAISSGLNKDNAQFLLAGYNTMSQEKKDKFDIINYLIFFKKFFLNLTLYSSLIYCGALYLFSLKYAVIVYTIFLVLSFIYFIIISNGSKFKIENPK